MNPDDHELLVMIYQDVQGLKKARETQEAQIDALRMVLAKCVGASGAIAIVVSSLFQVFRH